MLDAERGIVLVPVDLGALTVGSLDIKPLASMALAVRLGVLVNWGKLAGVTIRTCLDAFDLECAFALNVRKGLRISVLLAV